MQTADCVEGREWRNSRCPSLPHPIHATAPSAPPMLLATGASATGAPYALPYPPYALSPLRSSTATSSLRAPSETSIDTPHISTTRQRNPPGASAPSSSSALPLPAPSSRRSRRAGCAQQVAHRAASALYSGQDLGLLSERVLKGVCPPPGQGVLISPRASYRNRPYLPGWNRAALRLLLAKVLAIHNQ